MDHQESLDPERGAGEQERIEEDPDLLGIAKAVSDGVPVDWEDAPEEEPSKRELKAALRFVQSVVDAHRRVAESASEEAGE